MNSQTSLIQDFTTDPKGMILSMTYDTTGEGYDGELYFHYDHYGNTTLLTDTDGDIVASFEYDLHSGKIVNEWNPSGLEIKVTNFLGEISIGTIAEKEIKLINSKYLSITNSLIISKIIVKDLSLKVKLPERSQDYVNCICVYRLIQI